MRTASLLLLLSVVIVAAVQSLSAQNLAVGDCRPGLASYSTISAAVSAAAPNSTVFVCPGTYPEQVTITTPLTLEGMRNATTTFPVITVPSGGISASNGNAAQVLVQGTDSFSGFGPVIIRNLVIDGDGSGFDCSTGYFLSGVNYVNSSGSLNRLEVRNQNPGGCGVGVFLEGSPLAVDTVNVLNCNIHDFDNTGVYAGSPGSVGFFVNLSSNFVVSDSPAVQAGVHYAFTDGAAKNNTIVVVSGQFGLQLENFYGHVSARYNTVSGGQVGILSSSSYGNFIIANNLSNNGTGILVGSFSGNDMVGWNTVSTSATAAIDLGCAPYTVAQSNTVYGAPIGVANVGSGDKVMQNTFFGVSTATTSCQ
ncbi:MAG: NosD domain-containing protein [Terriglobales bacterium]